MEYKRLKQQFDRTHRQLKAQARLGSIQPGILERCMALDAQLGKENASWKTGVFLGQAVIQNQLQDIGHAEQPLYED